MSYDNSKLTNLGQMKSALQRVKLEIDGVNSKSTITTITIDAENWTTYQDIYKYSNVMSTSSNVFYSIHLSSATTKADSVVVASADIHARLENNTIVLYAYGDVPEIDFVIEIVSTPTNSGNSISYDFGDVGAASAEIINNVKTALDNKILFAEDILIGPSGWVVSSDENYSYEATLTMEGVTSDYLSVIAFNDIDVMRYEFSPYSTTDTDSVTVYCSTRPSTVVTIKSIACYEGMKVDVDSIGVDPPAVDTLENTSWSDVQQVASLGLGSSYWEVGDVKSITLNGTVGSLSLNNLAAQLYIIGFDHNSLIEGSGITFCGFKISGETTDLAIVDSTYGSTASGSVVFNMEHWGVNNYGGWKGCDLRYDILGSTNVAPSGYESNPSSGRTGYDPVDYNIITSPKANTLLAALPSDLRSVMKPITKYTDNVAGGSGSVESNVTSSIDYLPLLAHQEVFGVIQSSTNSFEANYQAQYEYYSSGNSTIRYRHNAVQTTASWWLRSPRSDVSNDFRRVYSSGLIGNNSSNYAYGMSPILLVG